jgi:hypothetical protein
MGAVERTTAGRSDRNKRTEQEAQFSTREVHTN